MNLISSTSLRRAAGIAALVLSATTSAAQLNILVKVENLAPANSISFAPLHVGFNNGTFDSFNNGQAATAAIISVAEGGSGSAWQPAFAATGVCGGRSVGDPGHDWRTAATWADQQLFISGRYCA